MHITSTINPNTTSAGDISVLLLSQGAKRVFVVKPRTYEKLEKVAREEFSLAEDVLVSFETCTLDVCQGQKVRISKNAYGAMWQCLDALGVVTPEPAPEAQVANEPIERVATPPVPRFPENTFRHGAAPPSPVADRDDIPDDADMPDGPPDSEADEDNAADDDDDDDEQPRPPTTRQAVATRVLSTPPVQPEEEEEHDINNNSENDDERVPNVVPDAPTTPDSQVANPQEPNPVENVPLFENGEEDDDATVTNEPAALVKQESLDDQAWQEARANVDPSRVPSSSRQRVPAQPSGRIQPASATAPASRGASSVRPIDPRSPRGLLAALRSPPHVYPPRSGTTDSSSTPASDDLRFLISIVHHPTNQTAIFKTRGGHLVRKVLTAACGQFGLDYSRATLILERNWTNVVGERETGTSICDPEQTISACRINEGSYLMITMDEDA